MLAARMRSSFRIKIALLAASCSVVPLALVGWLLIDVNAREVESASQALQIALTEDIAARVDAQAERSERALSSIARALTDAELDPDARVALALRLLEGAPDLDVVAVYDASGALIDRMRDPRAAEVRTPDRLDPALRREDGAIGAATHDEAVRALVVVPLRADDRVTGYAASPVSLAPLQREIERLSRAQLASDEGALMILDARGRALAHPDPSLLMTRVGEADLASASRVHGSAEIEDAAGRAWITTRVTLERRPWIVVARIPKDVAYASLAEMRTIVLATIALAIVLAALASFLLARRLSRPIASLVEHTKALAARRFDARVSIRTGDELSVLGDALNDAAQELSASEARAREEMAIRADLGRYLPAEIVEAVIRREQSMELGGRRVPVTVLFADVVAFTPLSDRLPPEEVVALLNELFTLLTEAVFRHGGTVDKFVGDCVMALFGAPASVEDHARRAILCAEDMLRFAESANAGWKERFGVEVALAIGVNTGDAVVGNVGSRERMEYTAIGDVVNVAARLETIARPQQILISRATREALGDGFELAPIGAREVPGRREPVELFEVTW